MKIEIINSPHSTRVRKKVCHMSRNLWSISNSTCHPATSNLPNLDPSRISTSHPMYSVEFARPSFGERIQKKFEFNPLIVSFSPFCFVQIQQSFVVHSTFNPSLHFGFSYIYLPPHSTTASNQSISFIFGLSDIDIETSTYFCLVYN